MYEPPPRDPSTFNNLARSNESYLSLSSKPKIRVEPFAPNGYAVHEYATWCESYLLEAYDPKEAYILSYTGIYRVPKLLYRVSYQVPF